MKETRKKITIVKRSCINGKIVWVYHGVSQGAAHFAYWQACKKEVRRVRQWKNKMKERRRKLTHILTGGNSSSVSSSVMRTLSDRQRKAAYEMLRLCNKQPVQTGDFYDHIIEEARQRNWLSTRWKENREKLYRYGKTHTANEYKSTGKPRGGDRKSKQYRSKRGEQSASSEV